MPKKNVETLLRNSWASAKVVQRPRSRFLYRKPPYLYFRFPGGRLERLPAEDAPGFAAAYDDCLARRARKPLDRKPRDLVRDVAKSGSVSYGPATVGRFADEWQRSDEFRGFKPRTQSEYRSALALLKSRLGTGILSDFTQRIVILYTDEIAEEFGASTSDVQRTMIRKVWDFAKGKREFNWDGVALNPVLGTSPRYKVKRRTTPWSAEAQETFLRQAHPKLLLAFHFLKFTAQRGGDAIRVKWSDIQTGDDGRLWIRFEQEKTGTVVWHKLPADLVEYLAGVERESEYVLTNNWRRPWASSSTIGHAIERQLKKLGITGLSMHGLRATGLTEIASLGVDTPGIKAVGGHLTDRMAAQYTREWKQRAVNSATVDAWDEARAVRKSKDVAERRAKLRAV